MDTIKTNKTSQIRGKRGSREQKTKLISFMEDNLSFAHERFESDCGTTTQTQKWEELTNELNSLGGAKKNSEQWKQYWRDLKRNVKAKAAEEKRKMEESGVNGLINIRSNIDDHDQRVISIITPDVIDGDGEAQERGLNRPTISYRDVMDPAPEYLEVEFIEDHIPDIPVNIRQRDPPPKKRRLSRPPFQETAGKLDKYLDFEKGKLNFQKEKFEFYKNQESLKRELERERLHLESRKAVALENISQRLKNISHINFNEYEEEI